MAKKETASQTAPLLPMLKTVEQMSKVSGIAVLEKINCVNLWIAESLNISKTGTAA